jgi:acyl-CoA reductase-like NAD-dependent aldehyde dehydrogenase
MGRPSNTDYHVRWLHYRQRLVDTESHFLATEAKRLTKEAVEATYDKHAEKKLFKRHVQERFKEKVRAYDEEIEERRKKLKELLCREEEEFILETIDQAQKGVASKMENMRKKAQMLKAQREEERQQIVNERRMLQYM